MWGDLSQAELGERLDVTQATTTRRTKPDPEKGRKIEHAAAHHQIRAEIEVADVGALRIHGLEALTSVRLLRQATLGAESGP